MHYNIPCRLLNVQGPINYYIAHRPAAMFAKIPFFCLPPVLAVSLSTLSLHLHSLSAQSASVLTYKCNWVWTLEFSVNNELSSQQVWAETDRQGAN